MAIENRRAFDGALSSLLLPVHPASFASGVSLCKLGLQCPLSTHCGHCGRAAQLFNEGEAVVLVGLLAAAVSSATPTSPGDAYSQCIGQSSSNAEFAECGEVYLRRLEVALKMAWNKAYGSLDDKQSRSQLLQEQRAWIAFKDKSCRFWTNSSAGREGQALHFYGCRGSIVEARISDLNGLYELTHQDEH